MCSGTSNYPWVTIWDIGMTYFGQFGEKCQESQKKWCFRGIKKLPTSIRDFMVRDGFLTDTKAKLFFKDVNSFLKLKLKLKAKPIKKVADIHKVWKDLLPKIKACQ